MIKTVNIDGVTITGEQVSKAMASNCYMGKHVFAFTVNGENFDEATARSLWLYDTKPKLVMPAGQVFAKGDVGPNVKLFIKLAEWTKTEMSAFLKAL
ncbi:MAG: hypothetical protein IIT58_10735 [Treponema sp.]|nr:hypothetical protein [Treponema sp.]